MNRQRRGIEATTLTAAGPTAGRRARRELRVALQALLLVTDEVDTISATAPSARRASQQAVMLRAVAGSTPTRGVVPGVDSATARGMTVGWPVPVPVPVSVSV